jgi:hypothetical protein
MKLPDTPSKKSPIISSSTKVSNRFSKKWIWGAVGVASALVLGVAVSRFGLPFRLRKEKSSEKSELPTALTAEWQLIEKIDRALQKAHIEGIDVYVKNGKVLLVATPEQRDDLSDARDLILVLNGVQSVEISVKEPFVPSSTSTTNTAS